MKHVGPKHLCDIEAIELIFGPPKKILNFSHFRPYQRWMTNVIVDLAGVYLGAEMGLGKTAATLKAVQILLSRGEVSNILIIAPMKVAEETWPEEIAKWAFARRLTYKVVTGTQEERIASLKSGKTDITIINRENLRWLAHALGVTGWRYDMVVYDEGSRLKSGRLKSNPTKRKDGSMPAKRMTELGVLDKMRFQTKKVVVLSGTPSPNGLIDLWGPVYLIDKGKRLGKSMTAFKRRWFRDDVWTKKVEPFDHSEKEIMDLLQDVFFSLKEEDYLDLPPLIPVDHYVKLTPAEMKKYNDFKREMVFEMESEGEEPEYIEAVNSGVLTGKLLQFANGSMYREDGTAYKIHNHKLDVLESIVEEAAGKPILVAYSFQFDRDAILKKFPQARLYGATKNDKRDWDAGKIPILVVHPASAGHGLNFQFGSNIAVWYGLTWSLELYKQFIKRLHRSGQKEDRVFLHRILTKGTHDEDVVRVLQRRGVTQDQITDAVRVLLAEAA